MNNRKIFRIIADIFILISIFVLPWWFSLFLMTVALFFFGFFFEILFFSIILDTLYSPINTSVFKSFQFTLSSAFLFVVLVWLKEKFLIKPRL